jgi:hypothetical protein
MPVPSANDPACSCPLIAAEVEHHPNSGCCQFGRWLPQFYTILHNVGGIRQSACPKERWRDTSPAPPQESEIAEELRSRSPSYVRIIQTKSAEHQEQHDRKLPKEQRGDGRTKHSNFECLRRNRCLCGMMQNDPERRKSAQAVNIFQS